MMTEKKTNSLPARGWYRRFLLWRLGMTEAEARADAEKRIGLRLMNWSGPTNAKGVPEMWNAPRKNNWPR